MEKHEQRKEMIKKLVNEDMYVPMKEKELAAFLQVRPQDREELSMILKELLSESVVEITKRGKYVKCSEDNKPLPGAVTGTFISNAKGFGFVVVEGMDEDLFIPEDKINGAFHNDTVEVKLLPKGSGKRQEAEVIRVTAHGMNKLVGTYEKSAVD